MFLLSNTRWFYQTCDHILYVVDVPRAVGVCIVPLRTRVFDVAGVDGDAPGLLLRCLVNLVILDKPVKLQHITHTQALPMSVRAGRDYYSRDYYSELF